jgi:hypothetical protein
MFQNWTNGCGDYCNADTEWLLQEFRSGLKNSWLRHPIMSITGHTEYFHVGTGLLQAVGRFDQMEQDGKRNCESELLAPCPSTVFSERILASGVCARPRFFTVTAMDIPPTT